MAEFSTREKHALLDAAMIFQEHGIEIALPWEGDLDDLDRERFQTLRDACRAYHAMMNGGTVPGMAPVRS
ncbi:hypothetical protein [Rhodoplanes sp. Z2-YC6860]|uniref:hypothetical protein n=1 Tax=Rhodoplanes sp. Z2-YC6860 TaxID=674703 RepID=UPI0012EEC181|nr:hypothetical protein [Rhodoplanes sp. Z2-YC6860]